MLGIYVTIMLLAKYPCKKSHTVSYTEHLQKQTLYKDGRAYITIQAPRVTDGGGEERTDPKSGVGGVG